MGTLTTLCFCGRRGLLVLLSEELIAMMVFRRIKKEEKPQV